MIIAGIVRVRERLMGIGQAITMPLFFASNALYPLDIMPPWLRVLSQVNPLSYQVDALRGLMVGTPATLALDFAVLAGSAALGIAGAAWALRRLVRCPPDAPRPLTPDAYAPRGPGERRRSRSRTAPCTAGRAAIRSG